MHFQSWSAYLPDDAKFECMFMYYAEIITKFNFRTRFPLLVSQIFHHNLKIESNIQFNKNVNKEKET